MCLLGLVGQRVVDRLGEGRMVVRRVVVDEQDLVVRIGHHLGQRIEADRRALVQIVAVAVVAAVDDDGEHRLSPIGYRPSALRAAAYSIIDGGAVSTTSLKRSSWNSASDAPALGGGRGQHRLGRGLAGLQREQRRRPVARRHLDRLGRPVEPLQRGQPVEPPVGIVGRLLDRPLELRQRLGPGAEPHRHAGARGGLVLGQRRKLAAPVDIGLVDPAERGIGDRRGRSAPRAPAERP